MPKIYPPVVIPDPRRYKAVWMVSFFWNVPKMNQLLYQSCANKFQNISLDYLTMANHHGTSGLVTIYYLSEVSEMTDEKRIIEINGVKLEIDLRTAKTIESYRVGDSVKVLRKRYGDTWESNPGVIIGFVDAKNHPGIELMFLEDAHYNPKVKFSTLTQESKDCEIAPFNDYEIQFTYADILGGFDREILKHQNEIREIEGQKAAFEKFFGKAFGSEEE